MDRRGVHVFSHRDFAKLFPDEQEKALEKSLQRLVRNGVLERVAKGTYVNAFTKSRDSNLIEEIALVLRRGEFSYVSLESMLSEYGMISQIPLDRITIMTTGPKGTYTTPYGVIEFKHTKRRPAEIIKRTVSVPGRPLRIATKSAALQDLRRVGRNTNMVELEELDG